MKPFRIYYCSLPSHISPLPSDYYDFNTLEEATFIARGVKKGVLENLKKFSGKNLLITKHNSNLDEETILLIV